MKGLLIGLYGLIKRHPYVTYLAIGIPSCFLMCTGALAISDGYFEKTEEDEQK